MRYRSGSPANADGGGVDPTDDGSRTDYPHIHRITTGCGLPGSVDICPMVDVDDMDRVVSASISYTSDRRQPLLRRARSGRLAMLAYPAWVVDKGAE